MLKNKDNFKEILQDIQKKLVAQRQIKAIRNTPLYKVLFDKNPIKKLNMFLLLCIPTQMINNTHYAWNQDDYRSMKQASITCKMQYKNDPCLKKFIKKEQYVFWAICGKESRSK